MRVENNNFSMYLFVFCENKIKIKTFINIISKPQEHIKIMKKCHDPFKALSAASTNSDRKSANSLMKSVWCPGGLYTVASTHITGDLLLTLVSLDNVI